MKNNIAIMILAHHNPKQLSVLIQHLQPDFDVYVQIDAKSTLDVDRLPKFDNVFYYKTIAVYWGHYSLVENMKWILEKAYHNNYEYYMYISGDDLPIKMNSSIKDFVYKNRDKSYMYANPLPIETWGFNKGFDRLDRYWFMKIKNRQFVKIVARITLGIQKVLSIKIKRFPISYYAGSQWLNLSNEAVKVVFEYIKQYPEYLEKLKYSRATDEMWVQSILMNSSEKENVINNDLRYIDWTTGPEFPRVLTQEDEHQLESSKALFARKFNMNRDEDFVIQFLNKLKS